MSNGPARSVVYVPKFSPELARAAGWRPPARVITRRTELEALAPTTMLLHPSCPDGDPCVWVLTVDGLLIAPGDQGFYDLDDLESHALDPGSLTVLYTPTEIGDTE